MIGITGSAGKTTTTSLVGLMAQQAFQNSSAKAWIGGNIGSPLIANVDEMQPGDLAVMELSSFQLELMTLSPQMAAVLNITPNHLDRHGTMEAYFAAKARILEFQTSQDVAILGRDDPGAWSLAPKAFGRVLSFGMSELSSGQSGTFLKGENLYLREAGSDTCIMPRSRIHLRGEHNLLNVLAACAIGAVAGFRRRPWKTRWTAFSECHTAWNLSAGGAAQIGTMIRSLPLQNGRLRRLTHSMSH